jgi:hypothetical protein
MEDALTQAENIAKTCQDRGTLRALFHGHGVKIMADFAEMVGEDVNSRERFMKFYASVNTLRSPADVDCRELWRAHPELKAEWEILVLRLIKFVVNQSFE